MAQFDPKKMLVKSIGKQSQR